MLLTVTALYVMQLLIAYNVNNFYLVFVIHIAAVTVYVFINTLLVVTPYT